MAFANDDRPRDIYLLICPIENVVRYVGLSIDPVLRFSAHCRPCQKKINPHKYRWIKNLKDAGKEPILKIIAEKVEKKEAERREIELIANYRSIVGNKLTNIHEGGVLPPPQMENLLSQKKVKQYNERGVLLEAFNSIACAHKETGIDRGSIASCCSGKLKRAGGFIFRWEKDVFEKFNSDSNHRKIKQFNKSGELIEEYNTIITAARKLEVNPSALHHALNGRCETVKGYIFRYCEDDFSKYQIGRNSLKRRVDKLSLNGDFIESYNSICEAARINHCNCPSNIAKACNSNFRVAVGFRWGWNSGVPGQ